MIKPQTVLVASSATPVFDGSLGQVFEFTLTSTVTAATFQNFRPGIRYVFAIGQDATGAHIFPWPANVLNAKAVNQGALIRTVQTFVCRADASLWLVSAGTSFSGT